MMFPVLASFGRRSFRYDRWRFWAIWRRRIEPDFADSQRRQAITETKLEAAIRDVNAHLPPKLRRRTR
jgi:hypothetical protein